MINFIVLGLPRSATTWMANWLTTDNSLCLHDPLSHYKPEQLEFYQTRHKYFGISCTGLWMFQDWLVDKTVPLIIERDLKEVNKSLSDIGLPLITEDMHRIFKATRGIRVPFDNLWKEEEARRMWRYLLPSIPFDYERYRLLSEFEMQPNFQKWKPNSEVMRSLVERMRSTSCLGAQ